MRSLVAGLTLALSVTLVGVLPATPAGADDTILPPLPTAPDGDPPGANNWKCKVTKKRPQAVILVHGTFGDRKHLLEHLSRAIKRRGFCVYSLDYGNRGTGDIVASARQLKAYVGRVRRASGAKKVSMVGHSQGGMMPRYYIKFLGGKKVVDDLVGIAPSNHGTTLTGPGENPIANLVPGAVCVACAQQAMGSPLLTKLNAGDETPGRISYTQITTRNDTVVVPHTSGYLRPGKRTTNLTLQNLCPTDLSEHVYVPFSKNTVLVTLDALLRKGPARKSVDPCR